MRWIKTLGWRKLRRTLGRYIQCRPALLKLGRNYVGARISGSLHVFPAKSLKRISSRFCGPDACKPGPLPDWLELDGPYKTIHSGLAWAFIVKTDEPGQRFVTVGIDCNTGTSSCQISLTLKEGEPDLGDVVLCCSPFHGQSTYTEFEPLLRVLSGLDFRIHCVRAVGDVRDLQPRTLVLHGEGLIEASEEDRKLLASLVRKGMNLIVLADEFFHGTTSAANKLLAEFDMQLLRDGTDEPGITREERLRRIRDWQSRYTEAVCTRGDIVMDPLTEGVRRLHWFRPCPVILTGPGSSPLVRYPCEGDRCLAAVSQPNGRVVAVGKSLLCSLGAVGWPYDNDRFLANLLVGGDAEGVVSLSE